MERLLRFLASMMALATTSCANPPAAVPPPPPADYSGYVNPKYIVIGVFYAPPGTQSNLVYTGDIVAGSNSTLVSSFTGAVVPSVSLSSGTGIPGLLNGAASPSVSKNYSQSSASNFISINQTASLPVVIQGFIDPVNGVDHNEDLIYVWLNPVALFTVSTASDGTKQIVSNGYGFDIADQTVANDMDVLQIPLGCLNGYFAANVPSLEAQCENLATTYARTWAPNNLDGTGPGLTAADLANIAAADPFSNASYVPGIAPGIYTTPDGRFTECDNQSGCGQGVDFIPLNIFECGLIYTPPSVSSQNYSATETFAVQSQVLNSAFWDTFELSLQGKSQMTWTYGTNPGVNNAQGPIVTANILGPPPGYSGPGSFFILQDNYWGTYTVYP